MSAATPAYLRRHRGRIVYHHADGVQGAEVFAIDVRPDGRSFRTYCEMGDGDLTRDASWTLDAQLRPVEGHVRVVQHGKLVGSSWYLFDEEGVRCEALTADQGAASQRVPGRFAYLGLHPLLGDGAIALARGTDRPGVEVPVESVTCSYDINGESAILALPITIGVTYLGPERIEVPAGSFDAQAYALRWQPQWPPAYLWVRDEDAVFLRLTWAHSGLDCQLEQYELIAPGA